MAKKRKFNKSKEWLIEQYVIFDRPRKEIAAECGLSEAGLKSLLAEFKILKNKFTIDKKELENLVNQKLSVEKIAKQLNCSESQWMYNQKEFPQDLRNKDLVYDLYINQKLSKKDLGEKYNCDPDVIDRILHEFKIPVRNNSESKIGLRIGENHPNWQGGITGLHYRLREAFYVQQVPKVLYRDRYRCQLCGSKKDLHVHHIKHFRDIFHRILNEHKDLDLINDQDQLYKIALQDKEFTNLNNLITYCKDCHFYKIHGYQRKEEKLQALQKSPELLETPEMDNQQPSIINTGSTTISNESTSKQMEVGDTLNSDDIV